MSEMLTTEQVNQLAEERFRHASKLKMELEEQNRQALNEAFMSIDNLMAGVVAGDRRRMLELLTLSANALRTFDSLPESVREALAKGLEQMESNLAGASDFLQLGRGERSVGEVRRQQMNAFGTAMTVEIYRRFFGLSLEDASAKHAEESGLTDSLIHKQWKCQHKEAKRTIDWMEEHFDSIDRARKPRRQKMRS